MGHPQSLTLALVWATRPDDMTDVVINNSFSDITGAIHHELRHVLLGDFGRMGNNAKHGLPEVDRQTKEAQQEADQNKKEQ